MQHSHDRLYTEGKYTKMLIVAALSIFILAMVSVFTQDIKAQEATTSDSVKEASDARRLEQFKLRGENVLNRASTRAKRLLALTSAIENVANKAKEKGLDTTAAMALITEAKASFTTAEAATTEARTFLDQASEESDMPTLAREFKTKVTAIYQELTNGRKKVIEAVQILKTLVEENNP